MHYALKRSPEINRKNIELDVPFNIMVIVRRCPILQLFMVNNLFYYI